MITGGYFLLMGLAFFIMAIIIIWKMGGLKEAWRRRKPSEPILEESDDYDMI